MAKHAKILRVRDIRKSVKERRRQYNQTMQPWQHGLVKTCTAIPMLFEDMKAKYGTNYIRTAKLNQAN